MERRRRRRDFFRACIHYRKLGVMLALQVAALVFIVSNFLWEGTYENVNLENESLFLNKPRKSRQILPPDYFVDETPVVERIVGNSTDQSDWQLVGSLSSYFSVYSAYYAHPNMIRVIAVARKHTLERFKCIFYDSESNPIGEVAGFKRIILENRNYRYSACFVICQLWPDRGMTPRFVSIENFNYNNSSASNIVPVQYSSLKRESKVDFALCVKPMYKFGNSDFSMLKFIEWVEFHQMMGVMHFTFYDHNGNLPKDMRCLMEKVYGKKLMTILPWTLPSLRGGEIRAEGIFAALNDCVYRHRGASEYLVIVDLDEMIVPRMQLPINDYADLIARVVKDITVGALIFRQVHLYGQLNENEVSKILKKYNISRYAAAQELVMVSYTMRAIYALGSSRAKGKYICRPDFVREAGNHFIWEFEPGYTMDRVPPVVALLHHYQGCDNQECSGDDIWKFVPDRAAGRFLPALVPRVHETQKDFAVHCVL